MGTQTEMTELSMLDPEGDELRVEVLDGSFYVSASQGECMATVGPFTKEEVAAVFEVAEMMGAARW